MGCGAKMPRTDCPTEHPLIELLRGGEEEEGETTNTLRERKTGG
jgi:hypothetical protein